MQPYWAQTTKKIKQLQKGRGEMVCTHTGLNKPKIQKVKERQRRKKKKGKGQRTKQPKQHPKGPNRKEEQEIKAGE